MESGKDSQLKRLLDEWQVPNAPETLERGVFGRRRSWWRTLVRSRVPIPLPIAIAFCVALVWLAVLAVLDRGPALAPSMRAVDLRDFQPVTSVHVRIVRSGDALP